MDLITIFLIAISLSMDAFAVSITSGLSISELRPKDAVKIATFFGSFQALMPVLGWAGAFFATELISFAGNLIAFSLLSFIGCRMIYESFKIDEEKRVNDPLNLYLLFLLSIATSIDAFAIGVSFAFLQIEIFAPIILIGAVTFILSFFGVYLGNRGGETHRGRMEMLGGLILIGIGIRILIEDLIWSF